MPRKRLEDLGVWRPVSSDGEFVRGWLAHTDRLNMSWRFLPSRSRSGQHDFGAMSDSWNYAAPCFDMNWQGGISDGGIRYLRGLATPFWHSGTGTRVMHDFWEDIASHVGLAEAGSSRLSCKVTFDEVAEPRTFILEVISERRRNAVIMVNFERVEPRPPGRPTAALAPAGQGVEEEERRSAEPASRAARPSGVVNHNVNAKDRAGTGVAVPPRRRRRRQRVVGVDQLDSPPGGFSNSAARPELSVAGTVTSDSSAFTGDRLEHLGLWIPVPSNGARVHRWLAEADRLKMSWRFLPNSVWRSLDHDFGARRNEWHYATPCVRLAWREDVGHSSGRYLQGRVTQKWQSGAGASVMRYFWADLVSHVGDIGAFMPPLSCRLTFDAVAEPRRLTFEVLRDGGGEPAFMVEFERASRSLPTLTVMRGLESAEERSAPFNQRAIQSNKAGLVLPTLPVVRGLEGTGRRPRVDQRGISINKVGLSWMRRVGPWRSTGEREEREHKWLGEARRIGAPWVFRPCRAVGSGTRWVFGARATHRQYAFPCVNLTRQDFGCRGRWEASLTRDLHQGFGFSVMESFWEDLSERLGGSMWPGPAPHLSCRFTADDGLESPSVTFEVVTDVSTEPLVKVVLRTVEAARHPTPLLLSFAQEQYLFQRLQSMGPWVPMDAGGMFGQEWVTLSRRTRVLQFLCRSFVGGLLPDEKRCVFGAYISSTQYAFPCVDFRLSADDNSGGGVWLGSLTRDLHVGWGHTMMDAFWKSLDERLGESVRNSASMRCKLIVEDLREPRSVVWEVVGADGFHPICRIPLRSLEGELERGVPRGGPDSLPATRELEAWLDWDFPEV